MTTNLQIKNWNIWAVLNKLVYLSYILTQCFVLLLGNMPIVFALTDNEKLNNETFFNKDGHGNEYQQNASDKSQSQQTINTSAVSSAIIRATNTSESEFKAFIRAEIALTYASYQLNRLRGSARPIHIEDLLKKSQAEFLSPKPISAMHTYHKVIKHIHAFDWNEEERKNIFYMLFRAAQLEEKLEKKKLFLQEALVFGQDLKLDFTLFPPPLVKNYLDIKKNIALVPLDLKKIFPQHELVLINGKEYTFSQSVLLAYGTYRVTAFSSAYVPWSKTIALPNLVSQVVRTKPLVQDGNCEAGARLNAVPKIDQKNIRILFPNFCTWNAKNKVIKKYFNAIDRNKKEKLSKTSKFIHKWNKEKILKWTAIGSGIFIGAMLLFNKENNKELREKEEFIKTDKWHNRTIQPVIKVGF